MTLHDRIPTEEQPAAASLEEQTKLSADLKFATDAFHNHGTKRFGFVDPFNTVIDHTRTLADRKAAAYGMSLAIEDIQAAVRVACKKEVHELKAAAGQDVGAWVTPKPSVKSPGEDEDDSSDDDEDDDTSDSDSSEDDDSSDSSSSEDEEEKKKEKVEEKPKEVTEIEPAADVKKEQASGASKRECSGSEDTEPPHKKRCT
jgi:hypothetical protein